MPRARPPAWARGAAASLSALVFVSLIVHAQWGCTRAEPVEAAIEPSEPPNAVVWPGALPPAFEPDRAGGRPRVQRGAGPVDPPQSARAGSKTAHETKPSPEDDAPPRRYLSSTKSDSDMWGSVIDPSEFEEAWGVSPKSEPVVGNPIRDDVRPARDPAPNEAPPR